MNSEQHDAVSWNSCPGIPHKQLFILLPQCQKFLKSYTFLTFFHTYDSFSIGLSVNKEWYFLLLQKTFRILQGILRSPEFHYIP